jgi:8-hydroxy-5-deazaflavin:NADPH oxidoreductase
MIMKIGILGSGKIGGLIGRLLAHAGYKVCFSSRNPEALEGLVAQAGPNASRRNIAETIAFGEVLLLSLPYGAVEKFGGEYERQLAGKIVIDPSNPYPERDGPIASEVRASKLGTGVWSARWLPGVRLVRGFNSVWDETLSKEAHRSGARIGVPLASDDIEAMQVAAELVRDAGFDPVIVGPLSRAKDFDVDTAVYDSNLYGPEVRKLLGLSEPA